MLSHPCVCIVNTHDKLYDKLLVVDLLSTRLEMRKEFQVVLGFCLQVRRWVDSICNSWDFNQIIPAHFDAPIAAGPADFRSHPQIVLSWEFLHKLAAYF